jgi:hypothetical protein
MIASGDGSWPNPESTRWDQRVVAGYPATRFARLLDKTGSVMTTTSDQTVVMAFNSEVDGWQALMGYAATRDAYFLAQEDCCWRADQVTTLLEAVISIGNAHTFGKLLYPGASSPQTDALTSEGTSPARANEPGSHKPEP